MNNNRKDGLGNGIGHNLRILTRRVLTTSGTNVSGIQHHTYLMHSLLLF